MPAVIYQRTDSCWPSSFPAASGVLQTRAIWPFTPSRPITWARCFTLRDSVGVKHALYQSRLTLMRSLSDIFLNHVSGPNAISVSLSPMGCYVMVGLASRRILLHPTTDHMVAQVFRLQQPHGGETSIRVNAFLLYILIICTF